MSRKSRRFLGRFLFFTIAVLMSSGHGFAEVTQAVPTAFFPETVFNFGLVLEGKEITHDFIIRNQGKAELFIQNVKPG